MIITVHINNKKIIIIIRNDIIGYVVYVSIHVFSIQKGLYTPNSIYPTPFELPFVIFCEISILLGNRLCYNTVDNTATR